MINLFPGTGHNNHAKCAQLYHDMMTKLLDTHPDLVQTVHEQQSHSSVQQQGFSWPVNKYNHRACSMVRLYGYIC